MNQASNLVIRNVSDKSYGESYHISDRHAHFYSAPTARGNYLNISINLDDRKFSIIQRGFRHTVCDKFDEIKYNFESMPEEEKKLAVLYSSSEESGDPQFLEIGFLTDI